MSCRGQWDYVFLYQNLSKEFVTGPLAEHMALAAYKMETAMMPDTVDAARRIVYIRQLAGERRRCMQELRSLREKIRDIDCESQELKKQRNEYPSQRFTIRCPAENCKGYVDGNFVCLLCHEKRCKTCREPFSDKHECSKETLATLELIKQDSRQCPHCHMLIYRIDGCDQMYCTVCDTPFNWRTGKIYQGAIHNPHYFARRDRPQQEDHQDRRVNDAYIGALMRRHASTIMMNAARSIIQIEEHLATDFRIDSFAYNANLRIKYINNEIEEKVFRARISNRIRRMERIKTLHKIFSEYRDHLVDACEWFLHHQINSDDHIQTLVRLTNAELARVAKVFPHSKWSIDSELLHVTKDRK